MKTTKILWIKKFKAGYILRREVVNHAEMDIELTSAYNHNMDYIGNSKDAHYLCKKRGISPEKRTSHSNTCSIGFCKKERKWFGWSHRAICGFGIGHTVKKGSSCAISGWTDEYLKEHPEDDISVPVGFEVKTLKDAKRVAMAFAESVS